MLEQMTSACIVRDDWVGRRARPVPRRSENITIVKISMISIAWDRSRHGHPGNVTYSDKFARRLASHPLVLITRPHPIIGSSSPGLEIRYD